MYLFIHQYIILFVKFKTLYVIFNIFIILTFINVTHFINIFINIQKSKQYLNRNKCMKSFFVTVNPIFDVLACAAVSLSCQLYVLRYRSIRIRMYVCTYDGDIFKLNQFDCAWCALIDVFCQNVKRMLDCSIPFQNWSQGRDPIYVYLLVSTRSRLWSRLKFQDYTVILHSSKAEECNCPLIKHWFPTNSDNISVYWQFYNVQ